MSGYGVYYRYPDGETEFVESFSDSHEAYAERDKLRAEVAEDPDEEGVNVIVVEEP